MSNQFRSYIIYNPVYRSVKKYIKRHGYRNYIVNTWNVCLDKLSNNYDMKLIWVKGDNDFIKFLDDLTVKSHCYHFWTKFPTISIDQQAIYSRLKDFIRTNKLWGYIEKIQTQTRLSLVPVKVKVITFHPKILLSNILKTFEHPKYVKPHIQSLYFAKAYEWLTPLGLKHFKTKIRNSFTHVTIYLLLDYYRTQFRRHNKYVINLIDLCSLRLAMFDPRYYQTDQCEVPGLIHKTISDIVEHRKTSGYFPFTISQYTIEHGIESIPPIIADLFLIYASDYCRLQSELELVPYTNFSYILSDQTYLEMGRTKSYEDFIIDFIDNRPYLQILVIIQSQGISRTAYEKLLGFPNLFDITINTDFTPIDLEPTSHSSTQRLENSITVTFTGGSEINFLGNYITWLKPLVNCRPINLHVKSKVANYSIFNDLNVELIIFEGHEINLNVFHELCQSEVTRTKFVFEEVSLDNAYEVLLLLQHFPAIQKMDIIPDENTFESIFKFIDEMFQIHDCNELEFENDPITFNITVYMKYDIRKKLDFSEYVFKLNSDRTKIDMYSKISHELVDLYDILFRVDSSEPREIYNFYD